MLNLIYERIKNKQINNSKHSSIIFYGILIIVFTSYKVYKLKKSKANHNN